MSEEIKITSHKTSEKVEEIYNVFVVDKSGSMSGLEKAIIDGFNKQTKEIKQLQEDYPEQKQFITWIQFDYPEQIEKRFLNESIDKIPEMTTEDYVPRGSTALNDAIGIGIESVEDAAGERIREGKAKALFVILTDGFENSSKKYKTEQIKSKIKELELTENWTFLYIGADKEMAHRDYGIKIHNSVAYTADSLGTQKMFSSTSKYRNMYTSNASKGLSTDYLDFSEISEEEDNN